MLHKWKYLNLNNLINTEKTLPFCGMVLAASGDTVVKRYLLMNGCLLFTKPPTRSGLVI